MNIALIALLTAMWVLTCIAIAGLVFLAGRVLEAVLRGLGW